MTVRLAINRGRQCTISARARHPGNRRPVTLLSTDGDDCQSWFDQDQLRSSLDADPEAIFVYNRLADAPALFADPRIPGGRRYTDFRLGTKGILGLHAIRERAQKHGTPEPIYP